MLAQICRLWKGMVISVNNVYLCVGKTPKKPFYVKFSDFYLYSMEELCYYFIDKIYVINEDIMCPELVDWIRHECGMEELADELDSYLRRHVSLSAFATTIMEKTGIYDEAFIKKVGHVLKEQSELTPFERQKKTAEYYYQTGRFRQALLTYTKMLEQVQNEDIGKKAMLYYNIASIYAMDFCYEQAAGYYLESYNLQQSKQTRQSYILSNRMAMTDFDFGAFMREHPEWKEDFLQVEQMCFEAKQSWQESKEKQVLTSIYEEREQGKTGEFYKRQSNLIKSLKEDYRRQTM